MNYFPLVALSAVMLSLCACSRHNASTLDPVTDALVEEQVMKFSEAADCIGKLWMLRVGLATVN